NDVRGGKLRVGICGAFGLRESRRPGNDDFTSRGVGEVSHPTERDCARAVSNGGRVVAVDAVETVRRAREGSASHETVWAARGTGESSGVFDQRYGGVHQWGMRGD